MSGSRAKMIELFALTCVLSLCSIVYELTLANTLAVTSGQYIFWHSMTIGFYIGGLGLGAWRGGKKLDAHYELCRLEIWLSLLGTLSVLFLYICGLGYGVADYISYLSSDYYSSLYEQNHFYLKSIFFLIVQSYTLAVGYLSGQEIPLLIKLGQKEFQQEPEIRERLLPNILGVNYIGTLMGTLLFAFFLLPKLDVLYTASVIGLLNLAACVYLYLKYRLPLSMRSRLLALAPLSFGLFILLFHSSIEQVYLKTYYLYQRRAEYEGTSITQFYRELDKLPPVERLKSLYQYIDIYYYERREGAAKQAVQETVLALDAKFQFSTANEKFYHEGFAHIPIAMTGLTPKKVLVLGGGDGLLVRELLRHPEIEHIDHIELDETVIKLFRERPELVAINQNSLANPRVHVATTDGFTYLRDHQNQYDGIFIDFPYPNNYNIVRLFSVEFYGFVLKNLAPHGFVALDAPLLDDKRYEKERNRGQVLISAVFTEKDRVHNSVLMSTMYYAGFKKLFPYKINGESFILLTNREQELNYDFYKEPSDYFQAITPKLLSEIPMQNFPYRLSRESINSIFHPRLLQELSF